MMKGLLRKAYDAFINLPEKVEKIRKNENITIVMHLRNEYKTADDMVMSAEWKDIKKHNKLIYGERKLCI